MTASKPHPQRCETCGHRDADRSQYPPAEYSCYCNLKRMWVHMYCNNWIGYVGCASHSSVSEPVAEKCEYPEDCRRPADCPETRIARQQEREKALDEIFGYISTKGVEKRPEGYYVVFGTFSLADMLEYLESLRQKEGKP